MDQIKSQLCSLRLSGMASCWQTLEETRRTPELSLKDGMELLLQAESDQRNVNRYARLLKSAGFRYNASIEELRAESARGMDRALIDRLAMGDYIRNGEAILITGSTGCGKSFLASALGNRACRQGYNVAYFNMQKLLMRLKVSRLDGSIIKLFDKLAKTDLLILDDFGLTPLQGQQQMDFMEIIEDRHAKKATIIASQLPVAKWFDVIGEETIADAILDRVVHTSYRFTLSGDTLRKKQ
ncbi:MAG: IS21-like element helper ATPase IstB [Eubacteriales bacterium]|jgi:DNA replication protein DnaC|nr:IS21-like element helper ATPase IstB [Eubacteriales bacterium]